MCLNYDADLRVGIRGPHGAPKMSVFHPQTPLDRSSADRMITLPTAARCDYFNPIYFARKAWVSAIASEVASGSYSMWWPGKSTPPAGSVSMSKA